MGFIAGIISVFLYDLSRVPYILGGWSDFIPKIGGWVTNTNEKNALLGYTWRYIGNGGGMGIAFFILMAQLNTNKHLILKAAHPSPFSAYNGFFGCKHFSKTNDYLIKHHKKPIDWSL